MTARRFWSYVRAALRLGLRTVTIVFAATILVAAAIFFCFAWDSGWKQGLIAVALVCAAVRVLNECFTRTVGHGPVWEWPDETVRREEREWQDARKGIELIAADPPQGSGTELEAGAAPEGTGTELSAGSVTEGPAEPAASGTHERHTATHERG